MNRCFIMQLLLFLSIFATFLSKDSKYFINPPQNKTLLYTFLLLFNIKTKHETVLTKNMKKKKSNHFAITVLLTNHEISKFQQIFRNTETEKKTRVKLSNRKTNLPNNKL